MCGVWLRKEEAVEQGYSILMKNRNGLDMLEEHFWEPTDKEMREEIALRLPPTLDAGTK